MEAMLGFHVGFWDYATFAAIFVIVGAGPLVVIFILGLPVRITIPRPPRIYAMGWVGFLAVVPWIGVRGRRLRRTKSCGRTLLVV